MFTTKYIKSLQCKAISSICRLWSMHSILSVSFPNSPRCTECYFRVYAAWWCHFQFRPDAFRHINVIKRRYDLYHLPVVSGHDNLVSSLAWKKWWTTEALLEALFALSWIALYMYSMLVPVWKIAEPCIVQSFFCGLFLYFIFFWHLFTLRDCMDKCTNM